MGEKLNNYYGLAARGFLKVPWGGGGGENRLEVWTWRGGGVYSRGGWGRVLCSPDSSVFKKHLPPYLLKKDG